MVYYEDGVFKEIHCTGSTPYFSSTQRKCSALTGDVVELFGILYPSCPSGYKQQEGHCVAFCTDGFYSEGEQNCKKCDTQSAVLGTACASCENKVNGNCLVVAMPQTCEDDELHFSSG